MPAPLLQGGAFYRRTKSSGGLIHKSIGPYEVSDVDFVLGIDIDHRKVGKPLVEAIFAAPNNTQVFEPNIELTQAHVIMGRLLDGVAPHMIEAGERGFQPAALPEPSQQDIVEALRRERVDVLINFLPVGSQQASEFYMECALEAGVGVVNAIPVFVASEATWEARFRQRGLPIVGDDIKAQVGATIIHRTLSSLFSTRGVTVERTYQLNTGGNTDFMNMLDRERLTQKETVEDRGCAGRAGPNGWRTRNIRIGPSEYVPWQKRPNKNLLSQGRRHAVGRGSGQSGTAPFGRGQPPMPPALRDGRDPVLQTRPATAAKAGR